MPSLLNARVWNIALRTAHLAAMGVLFGGYAFGVPGERLLPGLGATVATGIGLAVVESGGSLVWFHQGRGLVTLAKLLLMGAVPLFPDSAAFGILLGVVVLASVGSHMTARLRYYSIVYREVINCHGGPGAGRLADDMKDEESES